MPDEAAKAADAKAVPPPAPAPVPAPVKKEAVAESPPAKKEAAPPAKAPVVVAPPVTDVPSIYVDDLADLLVFKGIISREEVNALAEPSLGGTTVHRVDRLRYRFDPKAAEDVVKTREAMKKRANSMGGTHSLPAPEAHGDEEAGDLKAAPLPAIFGPGAT